MVQLLVLVAAIEIVLPVALALSRNRMLFYPYATPRPEEGLRMLRHMEAKLVHVVRPDGRRLAAYDVAPRNLGPGAPVVLFLHGNAGNIAMRADFAAWFAEKAQVRLLMASYSGYGGNEGSPSEDELNADALAAYEHLVAEGVAPERIVLYGESIGAGPALFVATKRRVAGVAMQAPISSLSSMALRLYPWLPLGALLVRGAFPNTERVAKLDVPVLVAHGTEDRIIPLAEGERLHAAARPGAELLRIEGADHNDLFDIAGEPYLRGLGDRFRNWVGTPR